MKQEKASPSERTERLLNQLIHPPASPTDPAGSYTGRPTDLDERPVQDADDL